MEFTGDGDGDIFVLVYAFFVEVPLLYNACVDFDHNTTLRNSQG